MSGFRLLKASSINNMYKLHNQCYAGVHGSRSRCAAEVAESVAPSERAIAAYAGCRRSHGARHLPRFLLPGLPLDHPETVFMKQALLLRPSCQLIPTSRICYSWNTELGLRDQEAALSFLFVRRALRAISCRHSSIDHGGVAPGRLATSAPSALANEAVRSIGQPR